MAILNRNVALVAPEWYEVCNVWILEKIWEFFKWEVNAALSRDEVLKWYYSSKNWLSKLEDEKWVNHAFSMLSEKNKIIKNNIKRIKYDLIFNWETQNEIDLNLCRTYFEMWYIKIEEISSWLNIFFNIKARKSINKIQKDWITKNDLGIEDMYYLSYWLNNNTFSMWEKMICERILNDFWIEFDYIFWLWNFYNYFQARINYFSIKIKK